MVVGAVPDSSGPTLSTWLFLGTLGAAALGVLAWFGWATKGYRPPALRPDLANPDHFYRVRGVQGEVDMGKGWRSTDDPHAAWHLWWVPATGEIIGLRYSELPPPVSPLLGAGGVPLTPFSPGGVQRASGMRVLGTSGDRPPKLLCDELRPRPDGLDHLTGGTWGRVPEPVDPEEDRGPDRG